MSDWGETETMDSPSESLLSSPARNPHIQSTEPLSPEEIAKIYSNNEAEAVAAVKRIIQEYRNDSWQNSSLSKSKNYNKIQMRDEEVADGLAKSLLKPSSTICLIKTSSSSTCAGPKKSPTTSNRTSSQSPNVLLINTPLGACNNY